MPRATLIASFVVAAGIGWQAKAQHEHNHEGGHDPLSCNAAAGEACYYAFVDDFHTPNSPHPDATGEAFFLLNAERTELRYYLTIDGLNLKPNPADRTEPDDIIGVHLHLYVPDTVGPHVLNIFGLATYGMLAEEDADLVVDYALKTLAGIYDNSDATLDPETGQPYLPFFPLTSKPLDDWLDVLDAGDLMIAVHTNASGFPTMAIHGHISRVVPEPTTAVLWMAGVLLLGLRREVIKRRDDAIGDRRFVFSKRCSAVIGKADP